MRIRIRISVRRDKDSYLMVVVVRAVIGGGG